MDAPETAGAWPDRRIADRYRLTGLINAGGSGTVWAAVDEVLGREVAIKDVVASPYLAGPDRGPVREHTVREAKAASRVDHPNVVHIYDLVEQDERPWIVMELVRAPSLAELIERAGPCTPHRVAVIGLQLLVALREIHANRVTHCDVKPSNVLVDGERAVLTDFGIATIDGETPTVCPDSLVGAPSYIAPERIRGAPATAASDLWSLGATLYTAVEGHPPHRRDGAHATLLAVATEDPEPTRRAGMLAPLLTGLLQRDLDLRPDAEDAERHLRRLIALAEDAADPVNAAGESIDEATAAHHRPTVLAPPARPARRTGWRPRRPVPVLGVAAAVTALAVMLAGLALQPSTVGSTQEVAQLPASPAEPAEAAAPSPIPIVDAPGVGGPSADAPYGLHARVAEPVTAANSPDAHEAAGRRPASARPDDVPGLGNPRGPSPSPPSRKLPPNGAGSLGQAR